MIKNPRIWNLLYELLINFEKHDTNQIRDNKT